MWIDERDDPFPGSHPAHDVGERTVDVEMFRENERAGAIGQVNGIVNACDPEHKVVVGGDLYKRPVERPQR